MVAQNLNDTSRGYNLKNQQVVPCGECFRCCVPAVTTCCSNRRNLSEAMFDDGSFDHSVVSQEVVEVKKMQHAYSLSKNAECHVV